MLIGPQRQINLGRPYMPGSLAAILRAAPKPSGPVYQFATNRCRHSNARSQIVTANQYQTAFIALWFDYPTDDVRVCLQNYYVDQGTLLEVPGETPLEVAGVSIYAGAEMMPLTFNGVSAVTLPGGTKEGCFALSDVGGPSVPAGWALLAIVYKGAVNGYRYPSYYLLSSLGDGFQTGSADVYQGLLISRTMNVGTVSTNLAHGYPNGSTITVWNKGSATAFIRAGSTSGTSAYTTDTAVTAGAKVTVTTGGNTYLAAITASGATTLSLSARPTASSTGVVVGPYAVIGKHNGTSALILGDSSAFGAGPAYRDLTDRGACGFMEIGLDDVASGPIPYANLSAIGTSINQMSGDSGNFAIREYGLKLMGYPYKTIFSEHGHNGAFGVGDSQFASSLATYGAYLKTLGNRHIVQLTITSATTSSDAWTTVAGQTLGFDATTRNTAISARPSPIDAVLDLRSIYLNSLSDQLWKILQPQYSTTLAAPVTANDTSVQVTDAPPSIPVTVTIETGANYEQFDITSYTGTGPYTVPVVSATSKAAKSHANGSVVKASAAFGTHSSIQIHKAMASGIAAAKNAGAFATTYTGTYTYSP